MNSQKTLICISAILLILSIFLTIFNRIYAFNKAGTDFVDFMTHFYDMKQYYKNNIIPTTGARFEMGPMLKRSRSESSWRIFLYSLFIML